MPTYGYRCTECGNEFERFQKISDPALTECESCGGAIKKMIYPVGIQFKGSGFYVNDYTNKAAGNGGGSAANGSASSSETGGAGESSGVKTEGAAAAPVASPSSSDSGKPAAPAPSAGAASS